MPGFVHSDLIPAAARGTTSGELYHITDWVPTLVHIAGGNISNASGLDGYNIWESLVTQTSSPRTELLYNLNPICDGGQAGAPKAAMRMNQFKLLSWCWDAQTGPVACPPEEKNCDPEFRKGPVLYDLSKDPGERINIAEQNPVIVQQIISKMRVLSAQAVQPMRWTPPYQGYIY